MLGIALAASIAAGYFAPAGMRLADEALDQFRTYSVPGRSAREIVVFTTATCPYCAELKQWLASENAEYVEYDLAKESNQAIFKSLGLSAVPTVITAGTKVVGFRPDRMRELLREAPTK